jgi:hypothetical protein
MICSRQIFKKKDHTNKLTDAAGWWGLLYLVNKRRLRNKNLGVSAAVGDFVYG